MQICDLMYEKFKLFKINKQVVEIIMQEYYVHAQDTGSIHKMTKKKNGVPIV